MDHRRLIRIQPAAPGFLIDIPDSLVGNRSVTIPQLILISVSVPQE